MSETPEIDAAVHEVLSGLRLPDGTDPVSAGRIEALVARDGQVTVTLRINPAEAPALSDLRAEAERRIAALPGVVKASVVLTAAREAPVLTAAREAPAQEAPRLRAAPAKVLPEVGKVVAVASGKGGVGKSTTSVNLALGLRALGLRVGILDADIYGPSLPTLLGLVGRPQVGPDRRLIPMEAFGLKVMSIGLLVDDETAMIWRGPMVMSAITQMLADVDWGRLDVLLIDMPPGTGDAQLAIAQGTTLAGAVIVSTPQDLALIDARRGIAMFRKVDVPVLGLVENMAHFICTDCGARHDIFGSGGAEAEAVRLGVPYLGAVPLTMELREASDRGRPVTALSPDGVLGQVYTGLARKLSDALDI